MTRRPVAICLALAWFSPASADPPGERAGGTTTPTTAKGIAPGGRGPARPRGGAFAITLPAKGRGVERVLPTFHGGPTLTGQTAAECVLFGKTRPIHIRVLLKVNGKPLAEAWDEHLRTLFRASDRNDSGFLNRYEFDYVFSPAGVSKLLRGKAYVPFQDGDAGPDFNAADRDKDGRVSFDEFRAYYAEAAKGVYSLAESTEPGPDARLSQALFVLLDRTKTGRVSAGDCKDVRDLIAKYDKNGDDMLNPEEILAARGSPDPAAGRMVGPAKPPPPAAAGPLSAATADCILLHYDSNRDGLLTKNEMEAALFTALDKNGDGKLTRDELKAWRAGAPDLIVTVSTGNKPDHCSVDISAPGGGTLPPWAAVNRVDRSHIVLRADGRVIEFAAPVGSGNTVPLDGEEDLSWPAGPNNRPSAVVREADLSNQNQVFRVLFDHMDADGNGTVTYDEYRSYMILQRSTAGFPVTVSYSTRSVDLFKRLDTNRDGRLSARELRAAYETLRPLDPSPDPVVTHAALEPSAVFQIGRPSGTAGPQANPPPPGLTAFVDESAPLWFRKMDVNGDGEITKKEFLGSAEHFKRLDTNGDGVISLEEANAYEAKRKK